MSRRAFLRGVAASGLAAAGAAGVAKAATRPGAPTGSVPAEQLLGDPIADKAAELQYDIERIFRFVSDEIRYEPYSGILRGARGTLAGRSGNSVDQALLLAALLEASLITPRFVIGPLADGQGEALIAAAVTDAATIVDETASVQRGTPTPLPADPLPPELSELVERVPELEATIQSLAEAQLAHGLATITDALAGEGIVVSSGTSPMPATEQERHVWIQVPRGLDWVDLDPTMPGSEQGRTIATAVEGSLEALPDELRHRIVLTVTAETISGASLAEGTIMEFTGFADELAGRPMVFLHAKPEGMAGLGIALAGIVTGQVQYVPILDLGGSTQVGDPITFTGGGGLLEDVGGEPTRSGEATAEWLEIRSESPDGTVEIARRTIFDRVGADARSTGVIDIDAIPLVELVSNGDDTLNEYPPLQPAQAIMIATGPTTLDELRAVTDGDEGPLGLMTGTVLFHLGRDGLSSAVGPQHGFRMFLDRPNVIIHGETGEVSTDGLRRDYYVDMLLRSFGAIPVTDRDLTLPPPIVAGVVSNVAERLALGEGLEGDDAPLGEVVSVGGVFDRAALEGIPTRVLATSVPADLALGREATDLLARALDEGWLAIVPESTVEIGGRARSGWWLVDPTTGRTIDQMDDGRGSSGTEHPISVAVSLYRQGKWVRAAICMALFLKFCWAFIDSILSVSAWPFFKSALLHAALHKPIHKLGCH